MADNGWDYLAKLKYSAYVEVGKVNGVTAVIIRIPLSYPQDVLTRNLVE